MNWTRELNRALANEKKVTKRERKKPWMVGGKRYTDTNIKAIAAALLGSKPAGGWYDAGEAARYLAANHYEVRQLVKP